MAEQQRKALKSMDRNHVAGLFLAHLDALHHVQVSGPGRTLYSFHVLIDRKAYYALCLVKSSDYWQHRLHLTAPEVSLVVCMRHDTVLPLDCLELRTGHHYTAFQEPQQKPARRNNRHAALIFLGQLLSGDDSAWQRLNEFPESTKYRYLSSVKRYSKRRQGRPLAV